MMGIPGFPTQIVSGMRKVFAGLYGHGRICQKICPPFVFLLKKKGELLAKTAGPFAKGLSSLCQDRRASKERRSLVKAFHKELGIAPFGSLAPYSTSQLAPQITSKLNAREKESLDIQFGFLEVFWLYVLLSGQLGSWGE